MAINKNHESEELGGIKCAVVERNVLPARVAFLTELLALNGYEVVSVASPPPKLPPPSEEGAGNVPVTGPEMYTVGVTDLMFNPVNAIFGRLLRTKTGRVVTLAYWHQKESISNDELPYFATR